ncbi:hypothetical protein CK203_040605 [Vitis vinifera]|uniref:Uncharacterized protein n=1 Tax=Vitis vinifera TaxID=29760 RepID=A0A438HHZ4_VITVI|nr:hypothetical protein CK203_040605 [Vitis vinifera]
MWTPMVQSLLLNCVYEGAMRCEIEARELRRGWKEDVGLGASINEHVYPEMQRKRMGNALNVLFLGLFSLHFFSLTFPLLSRNGKQSLFTKRDVLLWTTAGVGPIHVYLWFPDDEYDIISEECLLTVDENREGQAAAFGDE